MNVHGSIDILSPSRHGLTTLAWAALALAWLAGCSEQAPRQPAAGMRFDFEPRGFFPTEHYVKDHTLVIEDGTYHLFHITGTDSLGRWSVPGNEVDFGHATSSDLRHWTIQPRVVDWEPSAHEERNRWAPHVVRTGSGFRMYYTGVNRHIAQVILCAESTDLYTWAPVPMTPFRPGAWAFWSADARSARRTRSASRASRSRPRDVGPTALAAAPSPRASRARTGAARRAPRVSRYGRMPRT